MLSTRKRLLLTLIVPCFVLLFILACGSATDASSPSTVSGTVTSAPQAKHFKVGDQVKIGYWVVTINSTKTSAGTSFDKPQNGQYLILDITFKNTDSTSHTISSIIEFQFQDSTGQKYDDQITSLQGVTPPDGDVQAGSQTRGQVVYDVPKSEHTFTFTFTPDFGDSAAVWDISI
jgi:predicted secreted protein